VTAIDDGKVPPGFPRCRVVSRVYSDGGRPVRPYYDAREVWIYFESFWVFDPEPPITLGRACEEMWRRLILNPRPITMTWNDVRVTMEKLTEVKP